MELLKLANAVRTAIENEPLDSALRDALSVALERLGPGPFAVRSSMEGEDSTKHSFAGQLDSYLFQDSIEQVSRSLLRAARRVQLAPAPMPRFVPDGCGERLRCMTYGTWNSALVAASDS